MRAAFVNRDDRCWHHWCPIALAIVAVATAPTREPQLDGGTLLGMGRVGGYAIVGGTGAFAGASGAYVFEHLREDRGGDGSATFVIDLTA